MPDDGGTGKPGDKPPGNWSYTEVYDDDQGKQITKALIAAGYKVTIVGYKVIKGK